MAEQTLFDKIVDGSIPSFKVWEDDNYLAFLTPFPNTPGLTVVIPKQNPGDYIFNVSQDTAAGLMQAATKVAKLLEKALGVSRVALVFEGTGVAHVHAKLYPLHGELGGQTGVWSKHVEFYPEYTGYFSTVEGPRMSDEELTTIQHKITEAAK
ncbi:MAG TPA: HIT family protein [Candidatus Saccharimonadales bacterium]|nr:HIT family protein [Candidatus Saccharimonadales bacterium]